MATHKQLLKQVRTICLRFPDAHETETWGKPHFRVGEKIFAGFGDEDGLPKLGFKLEMSHAKQIVNLPAFTKAKYVGHKGWVSMDCTAVQNWDLVAELVEESYRLIAPKRALAKLDQAAVKGNDMQNASASRGVVKKASRTTAGTKLSKIKASKATSTSGRPASKKASTANTAKSARQNRGKKKPVKKK